MSQKLRGLVAQKMAASKADFRSYGASYPLGTFTWTCPRTAPYRIVMWSAGATGGAVSASGAHLQKVVRFKKGQTVPLVVGTFATNTTATLPDGTVLTCTAASGNTPGAATNGDINLAGSVGGTSHGDGAVGLGDNPGSGGTGNGTSNAGGGGAPGYGGYRGGDGASASGAVRAGRGGGGNETTSGTGGTGEVIIVRQNGLIA